MYKVLVVDDEVKTCDLMKRYLDAKGLNVITSISGHDALEEIKHEKPDIILLDIKMPGMDGIEVLKEIKNIRPEAMVIIHTAYADLSIAIDAIRLNAFDYVSKPVDLEDMYFRILNCIEKLKLHRNIKLLERILPVCCVCKKIRDDESIAPGRGNWMEMDVYLNEKTDIDITHTYCPECCNEIYNKEIPNS